MPKLMTVFSGGSEDVTALVEKLWAYAAATPTKSIRRAIDAVDTAPSQIGWDEPPDYPKHSAIEELWFTSEEEMTRHIEADRRPEGVTDAWHYSVAEHIRKDVRPPTAPGARVPGVKEMFLLTRPADKDKDGFVRHWRTVHGPLALRQHAGMSKYVQNVVLAVLTSQAPHIDGIAELHYPSTEAAQMMRYLTPEGRAEIAADRPHFVGQSVPLFCGELVVSE